MQRTNIEWCRNEDGSKGMSWNPVTGCEHGCKYCYAKKISMRFQGDFKPIFHNDRLRQPAGIKTPSTIFVGSMADLFGEWVPFEWIYKVLAVARECPQHKFIFLTKNPDRYYDCGFSNNCILGATVTGNTTMDMRRLGIMRRLGGFVSCEPLLDDISGLTLEGLSWIIIGSLNAGNGPVPTSRGGTHREWVTDLIKEAHGIPVFIKDGLYDLYPDLPKLRGLPYLGKAI